MANVTRQRTGELLRKLFEILLNAPEGMQAKDAIESLAEGMTLTEHEKGTYDAAGRVRRFDKIVRFATVDAVKAGWFLKNKGRWSVTDEGREAFLKYADPYDFYRAAIHLYNQWRKAHPVETGPEEPEAEVPTEVRSAAEAFEDAEEQAWVEVSRFLHEMDPYEFQELVADLLRAMDYHVFWIAPRGKDAGIDILASSDPLGTRPPRIKVQVKRREDKVTVDGLRSFIAVLGVDDVGLFVAAGGFTKDAEEEARRQTDRRLTLVDLDRLFDLWVEYHARLSEEARRRFPLKPIYFLAPEE